MIINKEYTELLEEQMENYYEEVLVRRAISDTRDGLISVQRKILYSAFDNGRFSNKKYTKCARLIGDAMSIYVHGDASLYDSMIGMGQEWKNNITLIDIHGNRGTQYGDEPAAFRYVEGRLSKDSESIYFNDIKSDCVDMVPTYDFSDEEPVVLPSRLPMYLINGNFGIAAGYMVSVPTHNPSEVIDAHIQYLKNPNKEIKLIPDFPTGGYILNTKKLEEAYSTGQGNVIIRSKVEKDENKHLLKITEIPYMKTLDKIIADIKDLCKEKKEGNKTIPAKAPEIKDIIDNSSKGKIDLEIVVKKEYSLDDVLNKLYKNTNLECTMPIIFVGANNEKFKVYHNIKEVIKEWIDFRRITIKRIKLGFIKKYKYRIHIIDGLLKILDNKTIDEVIKKIKKSSSKKDIIEFLMKDYDLTKVQSEEIASLSLYRLASNSILDLKTEKKDLEEKVNDETKFFKNKSLIDNVIIDELNELKKKYKNITRKTILIDPPEDRGTISYPNTNHTIIVTKSGYIKKLNPITSQRRNGKGNSVGKLKDNDYPVFIEELNNRDSLFIFTKIGKVYKINIGELNEGTTSVLGNYIAPKINNEEISTCIAIPENIKLENFGIMFATKYNKIKITPLTEFNNINKSGIIASKLNEDDIIIKAVLIKIDKERIPREIIVSSTGGFSAVIDSEDIPIINRTTYGCAALNNSSINEDNLIATVDSRRDFHTHVFVLSKNGFGKLVEINEFTKVKRGAKGMMNAKLKENDKIISVLYCNLEQEITIVSNKNIIKISASDIPITKRPTYGCSIKNLTEDEFIIDVTIM